LKDNIIFHQHEFPGVFKDIGPGINYGSDLRKEFIQTFGRAYEADHNAHDVISLSLNAVDNVKMKVQELVKAINE
jgi:hypothetical protein